MEVLSTENMNLQMGQEPLWISEKLSELKRMSYPTERNKIHRRKLVEAIRLLLLIKKKLKFVGNICFHTPFAPSSSSADLTPICQHDFLMVIKDLNIFVSD